MKENNGFWRKASVIITIITVSTAAIFGYGLLCGTVTTTKKEVAEMKPKVQQNREDIRVINTKLDTLQNTVQKGFDDIKLELRERQ